MPQRLALEGSGDLLAAFLKNACAQHNQKPERGQEGQGAESCIHHDRLL